ITAIFIYTTVDNVIERPDGIRIATLFILGILVVSIVSRVGRSFQLGATSVAFDVSALDFILEDAEEGEIRIISHEPDVDTTTEYEQKNKDERRFSHI